MLNQDQLYQPPYAHRGNLNTLGTANTQAAALSATDHSSSLTYRYQARLNQMDWRAKQCNFLRFIIKDNQTVFPYLQVPTLQDEIPEQFHLPLSNSNSNSNDISGMTRTRIAVLHVWSSLEEENLQWKIPPFFQYWLASAMANAPIADFLIFVPDDTTKLLLKQFLPITSSSSSSSLLPKQRSNIQFHVVGNLANVFHERIGDILEKAFYEFSEKTVSRLKPMFGHVFEKYLTTPTEYYSHWAWADMDLILGNLTKFLIRPIMEGYNVISMSSVEEEMSTHDNNDSETTTTFWSSHLCSRLNVALAGQLTVFANTNETRIYFLQDSFRLGLDHLYDERPFPKLLRKLQVRVAHVFAQVTDQFGHLDNDRFDWSPGGLFKLDHGAGCYRYEVGLLHLMRGKEILRNSNNKNNVSQQLARNNQSLEQIIFPGPFEWDTFSGFVMKFPVEESSPWEPYSTASPAIISSRPCLT